MLAAVMLRQPAIAGNRPCYDCISILPGTTVRELAGIGNRHDAPEGT